MGNDGFSLRAAVACGFTYMAESHFKHLGTCERAFVCVWRDRQSEKERERREGAGAPWKQLQQHKMEFVSTLPELCTSPSVSLTKPTPVL